MTNHTMCFTVVGQHISLSQPAVSVSDSRLYLRARFQCDESWDDLARVGVFTGMRSGVSAAVGRHALTVLSVPLDEDGECYFPEEVLSSDFSAIRVSLVGYSADTKARLTTDVCVIRQLGSGFYASPVPPAPDLYADMLAAAASAKAVIAKAEAGEFDGVTPHIGENDNWFVGESDTGVLAKGASGLVPRVGLPAATNGVRTLSPNRMYCTTVTANEQFELGDPIEGFDNEWDLQLTMGETAYQIALPVVRWGLGVAPSFAANSTTVCRLYRIGDVLCGEWVSV